MKFVYPIQGNESIYNWDLLKDPRTNIQQQILKALQTKKMTMDGPFKLLQGINGLVARKPIYQDGVFWGFVSVGVNLDQLLVEAGIKNTDTWGFTDFHPQSWRACVLWGRFCFSRKSDDSDH